MATGNRNDSYRGFSFLVEINGMPRAGFQECSGLDFTHDPVDYREVSEGPTAHKLPGQVKHATISLKRGITQDLELWEWRRKARDGKVERKNGSIVLLDARGRSRRAGTFAKVGPLNGRVLVSMPRATKWSSRPGNRG